MIVVIYYGTGARISMNRRLDAFADWRLIITGDDAAEMAVHFRERKPAARPRHPATVARASRQRCCSVRTKRA